MAKWLRRLYFSIGIHSAPPGTLFYFIHSRIRGLLHRRLHRYATGDVYSRARFGGTSYYDIARIRGTRPVDGLALIFFIGLGDYLFATPVIEALRAAHPGLLLYAFASINADAVNSPLVVDMLRTNRYIDAVFTYRGRPGRRWLDYDFRDCLKDIPRNFIILPVVYSIDPLVFHRVTSLLETFNLPVWFPVPRPILEPGELSPTASGILADIGLRVARHSARGVVCCHFGTRSSDYLYPYRNDLVQGLVRSGYVVVTLTGTDISDSRVVAIDVGGITLNDTIELLRNLKAEQQKLFVLSVNSVMWPVSAGLGITNLGIHIFHDESVHQYIYPNTFIVTQHAYPRISPGRWFLAPDRSYTQRGSTTVTDFNAEFILDCFTRMTEMIAATDSWA